MRVQHIAAMPASVRPTPDRGVFLVQSKTNKAQWYRVDTETLQCNCDSAMRGKAMRSRRENKGVVLWQNRCPHIGLALVGYALLHLEAQKHCHENT